MGAPVLVAGAAVAVACTAVGLKKLELDRVAQAGILSAAFFVASLIHVPVGPSSVHLILNGIVGLLLGWAAFPAILTALVLQAMMFQYGGITTLGVNTILMALPAVICYYAFRKMIHRSPVLAMIGSFACGFVSVLLSALLLGLALVYTEKNFWSLSGLIIAANFPVMVIEGIITVFCVAFLKKVHPEMLNPEIS